MNIGDIDEKRIQGIVIEILQDNLKDMKKIIKRMQITIILLIVLLVGMAYYYEWSFKKFLSQYDFETETVIDTNALNSSNVTNNGSINVKR